MSIPEDDRKALLKLARESVAAAAAGRAPPRPAKMDGTLALRRGCFVTLTNRGDLRGCIGTFSPTAPLGEQIVEMAAAATRDPRFVGNRITPREVPELTVQVSVLSELQPIEDPLDIELGVHGIYIARGGLSGCFLPEVATETGWSKEEFLSRCCGGKAGLAPDAWKDPQTKVYVFTSEKFADGPE